MTLATIVLALNETLTQTLATLAAAHGDKPGEWLDDLESKVIRDIKGMHGEGTTLEAEHAAIAASLAIIGQRFQALRLSLGDGR